MTQTPTSSRAGTARFALVLAIVSPLVGLTVGVVLMVHTSEPGCSGWVGCGTYHPLIGAGIACIAAGLLFAALFGVLAGISRRVQEIQAQSR